MKLVLGTAQFGLDYGITNKKGKVAAQEVVKILEYAAVNDINLIDTAIEYGDSESILGKYCSSIGMFEFISKIKLAVSDTVANIEKKVVASCKRLGVEKLHGLLVHNAGGLIHKDSILLWQKLEKLKELGLVDKLGASVYSPVEASQIVDCCAIDLLQFPFNLFDQRFNDISLINKLKKNKVELHARSVFLQGILLADYKGLNEYFNPIQFKFKLIEEYCGLYQINKMQLLIAYLKAFNFYDSLVMGITDVIELEEIVNGFNDSKVLNLEINFNDFAVKDERFINPSKWSLTVVV